jgi:hypothetical protein
VIVVKSPSLSSRPPAATGTLRMSSSVANWPLTRTSTRSALVSIEPLASTLFWLRRLSAIISGVMPSEASFWFENST